MPPLLDGFQRMTPLLCACVFLSNLADAADITDLPDKQEIHAALGYEGAAYRGAFEEEGISIGKRHEDHHRINLVLDYGLAPGFVIDVGLSYSPVTTFSFPHVSPMSFDPSTLQGTYLVGDAPSDPLTLSLSGVSDAHLGVLLQPDRWSHASHRSRPVWLVGAAVQFPSPKQNLWTHHEGQRHTSTGNVATRLQAALSKQRGLSDAYIDVCAVLSAPVTVDVRDANDAILAREVSFRPASTVGVRAGAEIDVAGHRDHTWGSLDVNLRTRYRSWEDIGSGVYLPSVLPSSLGVAVTRGESLQVGGALGGHLHTQHGWHIHASAGLFWETPYRPEHLYPNIRMTTNNHHIEWMLTLERRITNRKTPTEGNGSP